MNTDVVKIKQQVQLLILDLRNDSNLDRTLLQNQYSYLHITSKTLFDFIIKNHNLVNQNPEQFNLNLNKMLSCITDIQNNILTQDDASKDIGNLLANQFIPQLKKNT